MIQEMWNILGLVILIVMLACIPIVGFYAWWNSSSPWHPTSPKQKWINKRKLN